MSGEFTRTETNGNNFTTTDGDSAPGSPMVANAPGSAGGATAIPKNVEDVIYSDIGVSTLLSRLRQSIASARDFAAFLKKRSTIEEEQATSLRRLAKSQLETLGRSEVKTGSYASQLGEVMRLHERMADNGMQFALSLHQMHEDLNDLSANMERGRKQWKHEGLDAEKRASDAEAAMYKAKSRYDTLAEDYDRARTGDTKGRGKLGFKGPKSAEQAEQDLLRKMQGADQDYGDKVKQAKSIWEILTSTQRPKAVRALLELIRECDSALTLQLQKFATFNEKLILGNGLAVTPLTDKDAPGSQRSMRDAALEIDNETDLNTYVRAQKIPVRAGEIEYRQHPTLAPKTQQPITGTHDRQMSSSWSQQPPQQISQQPPSLNVNTGPGASSQPSSMNNRYDYMSGGAGPGRPSGEYAPQPAQPPSVYGHSYATPIAQQMQSPSNYSDGYNMNSVAGPKSYMSNTQAPPYPTHPSERSPGGYQQTPPPQQYQQQQHPASLPGPLAGPTSRQPPPNQLPQQHSLPPLRPVFGVGLEELFLRDQTAVPQIVVQCILAVDTFGLDVEGIYRQSGTSSHISTLKSQFDHDSSRIDFRNPAAFFHDVNSVASLLKLFFKESPEPLFTHDGYQQFIEAARIESDEQRRDALHQGINDLPDSNYATLRAVVLHLGRVMGNEERNRMGSGNLSVCFAPSLMGTQGGQIADAGLQARVLDTILQNATAIFDED